MVKSKKIIIISILLFIVLYVKTDYNIMFDLKNADIAKEDIYQYSTDWTSGKNILKILSNTKDNGNVCVTPDYYFYFVIIKQSYFQHKNINLVVGNEGFNPMSL